MTRRYEGKIVLVTGGASGIGRRVVTRLIQEGASVAFTDIQDEQGEALARQLADAGANAMFLRSDAREEDQVRALMAAILGRYGRLDVAINNVGHLGGADRTDMLIHETTIEAWESTLASTLKCTFLCMKHEIIQMLEQGAGVIANVSSLAGMRVTQFASASYTPAKAGIIHMSRQAAVLYATKNIRVNVVAPGMTATEGALAALGQEKGDEIAAAFHPMGRMVTPDEVAEALLWVCSDGASGITGHTVPVDGGWAAR
jgi:NAD(P)-dependent dehydrogenase (short-subunit alcohol dehydrogenase family)